MTVREECDPIDARPEVAIPASSSPAQGAIHSIAEAMLKSGEEFIMNRMTNLCLAIVLLL